jgi:hypothetical protein
MGLQIGLMENAPNLPLGDLGHNLFLDCLIAQLSDSPVSDGAFMIARLFTGQRDNLANLFGGELRRSSRAWGLGQPLGNTTSGTSIPTSDPL